SFLINMSNQIRTPISSIMGMNTMIMNTTHEVETKAFSQDIRNSAKTLMGVVNDILDYAKIQNGSVEIVPVQYDLRTTIRTVHDMVRTIAEEKELELRYEIDENLPSMLYGDEIRIRQCLLNLMSNAVKYTKHGMVSFSIHCEKNGAQDVFLRFIIRDTGMGMSEEQIQRLMHSKVVVDSEDVLSDGDNIGASIVNYLLDSMGAQLHVHSTLGEGTEVSFRLLQRVINWDPGDPFDVKHNSV
nr:HAMP domain-containing histidine kinase [Lachnospiraceae bacterium]